MRELAASFDRAVCGRQEITAGKRSVPEETAVALSYNGGTYAVMMASPTRGAGAKSAHARAA